MSKTVTITIAGPAKSGKKAVGELVSSLLTAAGFTVDMADETYADSPSSEVSGVLARLNRDETTFVVEFEKTPAV
jgi:uridine kinase